MIILNKHIHTNGALLPFSCMHQAQLGSCKYPDQMLTLFPNPCPHFRNVFPPICKQVEHYCSSYCGHCLLNQANGLPNPRIQSQADNVRKGCQCLENQIICHLTPINLQFLFCNVMERTMEDEVIKKKRQQMT